MVVSWSRHSPLIESGGCGLTIFSTRCSGDPGDGFWSPSPWSVVCLSLAYHCSLWDNRSGTIFFGDQLSCVPRLWRGSHFCSTSIVLEFLFSFLASLWSLRIGCSSSCFRQLSLCHELIFSVLRFCLLCLILAIKGVFGDAFFRFPLIQASSLCPIIDLCGLFLVVIDTGSLGGFRLLLGHGYPSHCNFSDFPRPQSFFQVLLAVTVC